MVPFERLFRRTGSRGDEPDGQRVNCQPPALPCQATARQPFAEHQTGEQIARLWLSAAFRALFQGAYGTNATAIQIGIVTRRTSFTSYGKTRIISEIFFTISEIFFSFSLIFFTFCQEKVCYKLCNGHYKLANTYYKLCNTCYKVCNKNFLYDRKDYQQANKKYLLWSEKSKADKRRFVLGQAKKKRARRLARPFQQIFSVN